ncbi:MAG: aminoglycoside/choline kinase family phosphotransferase [Halioglobus sp.]|jgi:aminoglycoside/choline kinase family phosphotransferase
MAQRPVPLDLLPWAMASVPSSSASDASCETFSMVAGDASNRRYFRLETGGGNYIVAEAPPATENNAAFVAVGELLAKAHIAVPRVLAVDYARGYLLLQDLGDRTLLPELNADTVDGYYAQAFDLLHKMATVDVSNLHLPDYSIALLTEELGRFPVWFAQALLGLSLSAAEQNLLHRFNQLLLNSALEQPRVVVHRDFHSRNIMLLASEEMALIDFQDAVVGPITYDPVSLLRDCYVRWPSEQVQEWALAYREQLCAQGQWAGDDGSQFVRWFDWMGLQRHIKVLGTFARLHLRDGKPGYLDDLPMVIAYVEEMLDKYAPQQPVFAEFKAWFEHTIAPLVAQQTRSGNL